MTVAIALTGGEAHGAWFEEHQLEGTPETVRVAIAIDGQVSLLDLPDDTLELGERELKYIRSSVGFVCVRHGKGRGCNQVATYVYEGVAHDPLANSETRRRLLEDAGIQPALRVVE